MSKITLVLEDDSWSLSIKEGAKVRTFDGEYFSDTVLPKKFSKNDIKLNYQLLKVITEATNALEKERV